MRQGIGHSTSDRVPLIDRIGGFLSPPVFFCAVAIGFLSSALLGNRSAQFNMFRNFVRIHQLIGTETLFDVTALQIHRLLQEVPASKILVVVGGSSRLNGVGQRPQELWSRHLQERLGADYAVVNLALRAGAADQFGSHAAEAMIKAGRRVLYIADWGPIGFVPVGGQRPYWYFFYDSLARDLLLDSPIRDQRLEEFESRPEQAVTRELRLRSRLNRWLYFNDLWTYAGYHYAFFAGWDWLISENPFAARSTLSDPEQAEAVGGFYRFYDFEQTMRTAALFASAQFANSFDQVTEWGRITPTPLRDRSLIVWIALSPFYTHHFSGEDRSRHTDNMVASAEALRHAGFRSIEIGRDWAADDFVDLVHVSEKGGRKLVDVVAPLVTQMARDHGYIQ
jgi:hypothetical protein